MATLPSDAPPSGLPAPTAGPVAALVSLVDAADDAGQTLKTCYPVAARRLDRAPL